MRTIDEIKTALLDLAKEAYEQGFADGKYNKPCFDEGFTSDVSCQISDIISSVGIDDDRLEAICAAEIDGHCVVLPCKVGGDIYWINDEEKCVSVHKNGIRGIVVRNGEFAIEDTDGYIDVAGTKYCYLTREEAKRALKGGE